MTYQLPGCLFITCCAMLQWPRNDLDVPFGRIVDARLHWNNNEKQDRAVDCVLYYAESNLEEPVTSGLYDIETTVSVLCTRIRTMVDLSF